MSFWAYFLMAFRDLRTNKVRSFLTMLGVVIGVYVVITMVNLGEGMKLFVHQQFSSWGMGVNTIGIYGVAEQEQNMGMMVAMMKSSITHADVNAVRNKCPSISYVVPDIMGAGEFKYGQKTHETSMLIGTSPDYAKMVPQFVAEGRFFTEAEVSARRRVVFLGQSVVKGLFGDFSPLGEKVKLNGVTFTVIGIMDQKTSLMGFDFNDMVFIPITTGEDLLKTDEIIETWCSVKSEKLVPQAIKEIKDVLISRHGKEDFQVRQAKDLMGTIDRTMTILTVIVSFIAGISLLVGGIGIMNIMLVSVAERFQEIGIRKSVGATTQAIFLQFLSESAIISLLGGAMGILLSALTILIAGKIINLNLLVTPWSVMAGISVALLVGVISGVYPAIRAASLSPVEAMRR